MAREAKKGNNMTDVQMIAVEVAYAEPEKQKIIALVVEPGTTMLQAVKLSGIMKEFPQIDLDTSKLGIFGQAIKKPNDYELKEGDRIEIYRPLLADPKEVRRRRAEKAAQKSEWATILSPVLGVRL